MGQECPLSSPLPVKTPISLLCLLKCHFLYEIGFNSCCWEQFHLPIGPHRILNPFYGRYQTPCFYFLHTAYILHQLLMYTFSTGRLFLPYFGISSSLFIPTYIPKMFNQYFLNKYANHTHSFFFIIMPFVVRNMCIRWLGHL